MTAPEQNKALVRRLVEIVGVDEIYTFRIEDGKLSSAIAVVEDNLTRMRQLGIPA